MILEELCQIFGLDAQHNLLLQLRYPLCLMTVVDVSEIAGAIALVLPRALLLKVLAYPGPAIVTNTTTEGCHTGGMDISIVN